MRLVVIVFFLLASVPAPGADNSSPAPETVVRDLYTALMKARPQPLARELRALSVYLSKDLNRLIADAQRADAAYLKKNPTDKGILGDGTCFFYGGGDCSFTSYKITKTSRAGAVVTVTVHLTLTDSRPGFPSASWDNVVELKRENNRWVIDDIGYFDSKASKILRESTEEARSAVRN